MRSTVAVPSFSHESECLVLSAALCSDADRDSTRRELMQALTFEDFYVEQHGGIWLLLRSIFEGGQEVDAASLLAAAERRGVFIGGAAYVISLLESPLHRAASTCSVLAACRRIKELALTRKLAQVFQRGLQLCSSGAAFGDIHSVVDDALKDLSRSTSLNHAGPQHLRNYLGQVFDQLQDAADGKPVVLGVSSGLAGLDLIITGFGDGELIILAARPSMGKTALALQFAETAAIESGVSVLLFSIEMGAPALARRALARKCRIPLNRIRQCTLIESDWERLTEGGAALSNSEIYIDDTPGLTLSQLRARARDFKRNHPKCMIVIDYLQLVGGGEGKELRIHISGVSGGLKQLAKEIGSPVVALSQLSRTVETRVNKRPMLSDLRESGSIEQDADLIMFIYRDEYYNKETKEPGIAEIIVAKQRDGQTGTAKTYYEGPLMNFTCASSTYSD